MKKLLIALILLPLYASAGLVCNDKYEPSLFGGCEAHNGVDLQASFPSSKVDTVEMMALTAYNKFHSSKVLDTGILRAPDLNLGDNCYPHSEFARDKLAEQNIGGEIIVTKTEFAYHAAFMTDDGRVIDINHKEPLSLGEWLAFTSRI